MPNPKLPVAGTHNLQERYAQTIVKLKRKQNIVRNFFHTDYMGDPRSGSVKIANRPLEVAVADYNVQTGATLTFSTTDYIPVLVDNHKAINELIDGYEAAAVPDNIVAQRLDSGAYSLGRRQELDAIEVLENGGTIEPITLPSADATIYANIVKTISAIKRLGVPKDDLVCVISDDTEVRLMTDTKYSNTASVIGAELVREGVVSKIAGVPVVVSSNLRAETEYIVFGRSWAGKCEDWVVAPAINDIKDAAHIGASVLQGRMVYKDVLTDPTTCRIKRALAFGEHLDALSAAHEITALSISTRTITFQDSYPATIDVALDDFEVDGFITTDKVWPNGTFADQIIVTQDQESPVTLTPTNLHLGGRMSVYLSELVTAGLRNDLRPHADKDFTITVRLVTPQAVKLTITVNIVVSKDDFATQYTISSRSLALDIAAA